MLSVPASTFEAAVDDALAAGARHRRLGTRGGRPAAVERMYRELRADRIWEGTSEIQRLIIANELIERGVDVLRMPGAQVANLDR